MDEKIAQIAAQAMRVNTEEAQRHCKPVPELDAFYFWNPVRGGISVIVNSAGEKLAAASSVNFDRHVEEFKKGRRN